MLAVLGPAMASWPLALRTLVLSVTMVVALTWLIMPRLTRLFRPWLSAGSSLSLTILVGTAVTGCGTG